MGIFPKLVHLTVDPFSINDQSVQDLKKLNLKELKIIGDSLSSVDFLNDLNIKNLLIVGFLKNISKRLKLSNLEGIHLVN